MQKIDLAGCELLLVEDEPLVMMDLCQAFENVGAKVHCAQCIKDALRLLSEKRITAAVLDYKLGSETADDLCKQLKAIAVPFAIYSGYRDVGGNCAHGEIIMKPALGEQLVQRVVELLAEKGLYAPA